MRPLRLLAASVALSLAATLGPLAVAGAAPGAPATAARPVGGGPLDDVLAAANANARPACNLTGGWLAAMMLSVVFHETGATGSAPPSPMTLSRWDVNAGLFANRDPNTPFRRAYWNPGIGMWQMDSAGLGRHHDASFYINTATAAPDVALVMANEWCRVYSAYTNDGSRRAAVWRPWHACQAEPTTGRLRCEEVFAEIYDFTTGGLKSISRFENVSRTGGMQPRRCHNLATGAVLDCWWVNPALAEGYGAGNVGWANPNSANANPTLPPSPLSLPFYVYEAGGREYRHWLRADTGYAFDITASRRLGTNARNGGLTWSGPGVCDLTLGRGACGQPATGPARPVAATHPAIVGQGRGVGLTPHAGSSAMAERRADGTLWIGYLAIPFWSGWSPLDGIATSDPDLVSWSPDHLEVFARGTDGAIWRRVLSNGAGGWVSLGGSATSAPAVVSRQPGVIDLFARGNDGALWTGRLVNGAFGGWTSLGGFLISDPEVTTWGQSRLDVFAVGGDRQLYHRSWDGAGWTPWTALGGTLASSPGAVSAAAGRIDVGARGTDGAVYTIRFDGAWSAWSSRGGSTVAAPELTINGTDAVLLVARGSDNRLYRVDRTAAGVWNPWAPVP